MAVAPRSVVVLLGDAGSGNVTSRVLTPDAGWQVNDLVLVALDWTNNSALTVPSGWTVIGGSPKQASTSLSGAVVWKLMTSGDLSGTATFTIGTATRLQGVAAAFSGVSTGTPIDSSNQTAVTASNTNLVTGTDTTVAAVTYLVGVWAARWTSQGNGQSITEPGTFTRLGQASSAAGAASVQGATVMANLTTNSQGAGASLGTYTATTTNAAAFNVSHLVALTSGSVNATVSPPTATSTTAAPTPTINAGSTVSPPTATATAAGPTPTVTTSSAVTAPAATSSAAAPVPTLSTTVTVSAPVAAGTASSPAPTVTADATISAPAATTTTAAAVPTISATSASRPAPGGSLGHTLPTFTIATRHRLHLRLSAGTPNITYRPILSRHRLTFTSRPPLTAAVRTASRHRMHLESDGALRFTTATTSRLHTHTTSSTRVLLGTAADDETALLLLLMGEHT